MSGCAINFPVYSVSGKNVGALRSMSKSIQVGDFKGDQESVWCRGLPIKPAGGGTFASYIRNALNDEIIIAGGTPTQGTLEVVGTLKTIDVWCGTFDASWTIEMEFSIDNQAPFTVKTVRTFDGNFVGAWIVNRAYNEFVPAVQDFLNGILTHPSFQSAVQTKVSAR
jgi:hypothetical protein